MKIFPQTVCQSLEIELHLSFHSKMIRCENQNQPRLHPLQLREVCFDLFLSERPFQFLFKLFELGCRDLEVIQQRLEEFVGCLQYPRREFTVERAGRSCLLACLREETKIGLRAGVAG